MNNKDKQTKITDEQWKKIKKLFSDARFNFVRLAVRYYSIATVNKDGIPHVSPFGSVILTGKNKGIYFEGFSAILAENLKENKHVCIMAVNTTKRFIFKAFLRGKLLSPLAIRLNGIVSEKREATPEEKKVLKLFFPKWIQGFKGPNLLLGKIRYVRDINFTSFENINAGEMTYRF